MSAVALTGKELAAEIRAEAAEHASVLGDAGTVPRLAVVVANDDEASAWYVRSIAKIAAKTGIVCDTVHLGPYADVAEIRANLGELSADDTVHGIILQTPLPSGVGLEELAGEIDPAKDIDGANPLSLGRRTAGVPAFAPATAAAVLALLDHHGVELEGRHAVVLGRSTVVGKPAVHLLLERNATVSVCHSRTRQLAEITRNADVVVAAVGRPGTLTREHVSPGAVVVDVGTNPTDDGGLVGDVDADAVAGVAGALTPVPGGVGPVTSALLMRHTVEAAAALHR